MTEENKTAVKKLGASGLKNAEFERIVWTCKPSNDVEIKDLLEPAFWANVAAKLRIGHQIEAVPPDQSFFVRLLVVGCDRLWAKVIVLQKVQIHKDRVSESPSKKKEDFVVKFNGPKDKWVVLRGTDKLVKGKDSREEADAWLADHKKETKWQPPS